MAKIRYSRDADALLIRISDQNIDHAEDTGQFIVHVTADGEPVVLEVLEAREFVMGALSSVLREVEANLP
jgi:uncharacterized protein YuzE